MTSHFLFSSDYKKIINEKVGKTKDEPHKKLEFALFPPLLTLPLSPLGRLIFTHK